ncbi:restriction endonuclease subunit S [Variovorax sp. OV700]|uniref:restriction endonuclease subunit S n=1 Tax=Variovorax sp. OV700 TaxID=1882826 RepID=UPI00088442E9|nr:restriction endonuclease subunit S [Variovorax sp. OV700]SDI01204.1 type I restriction enzyme, S subunit [Variovorax sp. OV700]
MNWPLKRLSELCLLAVDCVNKTAPIVEGPTSFKMIRTTNVKRGFIDTKIVRYVSENTYEQWTRRSRPLFGDVILTREAPVGEVGRCTFAESEQIFLGQRLFQYRPDPALLDWNYLAFALQSPQVQNKLRGLSFGATVPHIKVGDAEHLEIPCPPLVTQQAIGGLLAAYDDLIETNQARICLLEESARLLYREWFVSFRYPGHSIGMSSGLPQGWRTQPLAEMAEVNRASLGAKDKPEEIRYVDIASVETGVVLGATKMPYVDAPGRARRLVQHGDVIWSCVRPNRRSYALLWEPGEDVVVSTGFAVLTASGIPFSYLYFATTSDEFVAYLTNRATGAAYPAVSGKDFEEAPLLCPSSEVLQSFDERCLPILELRSKLILQNAHLTEARNALLPKIMSGALAV